MPVNDTPVATVLLVEDDETTRTFLADNLCADGYEPILAGGVREGLTLAETHAPDLAIIDVGLPDATGLDFLTVLRGADGVRSRVDPHLPVLVLSGRGSEIDRLRGFERGADDYVAKPFSYPELRARVQALLRRVQERRGGVLRAGPLVIDQSRRSVKLRGEDVAVSGKEYLLLCALASEPLKVWTKTELMKVVWGTTLVGTSRTLDSHACRLRRRLGEGGDRFVINVWGVGYRLCDPVVVAR